jgi:glycogen debranching enzyme
MYLCSDKKAKISWKWSEWADRLRQNFERYFFIAADDDSAVDDDGNRINDAQLINRRPIIKDCWQSSARYSDYQLRPNFAITLAIVILSI